MMPEPVVTRFAPSPTGRLHAGHAYSALAAYRAATDVGGRFLLRIEDIDFTRCRPEFETALLEDLRWLGLHWEEPVRRQSEHLAEYQQVICSLRNRSLLYPCFCTRRDIQQEIEAAGGAPQGEEGPLYPGTCRDLSVTERERRMQRGDEFALRLNLQQALESVGRPLTWHDQRCGPQTAQPELFGDVVLARKDIGCSYHIAAVVDDALQGINLVVRGEDLFHATHLHRLLQALLNLPTPQYHHHRLIADESGQRLAKRRDSESLQSLRAQGMTPDELMSRLRVVDEARR
ncbi:MAG: tRNA glutamyl-Q(34) synthetase GluQRS [Planctomycetaceae bacterium]|nr:tRNA glutamyl-Q(34) synthetase GluQRS [Planctomycetaceae bacterium]